MAMIHVVSATAIHTAEGTHHLAMCGEDLGPYEQASKIHPVGNYLASWMSAFKRVTCQGCRDRVK